MTKNEDAGQSCRNDLKRLPDEPFVGITSPKKIKREKVGVSKTKLDQKDYNTCKYSEQSISAKYLLENKMSSFIQNHVNHVLQKIKCESKVGEILIRNIYSRDCIDEVVPRLLLKFPDYEKSIFYRKKGILAFQVLKNEELLFFGFEVEEYLNQTSPNDKKVHLTYLDSFKL